MTLIAFSTEGKNYNKVRKALCSGFFHHAAKKDPQEGYRTLSDGTPCYIHPSSSLFNRSVLQHTCTIALAIIYCLQTLRLSNVELEKVLKKQACGHHRNPEMVIYHELVTTTKEYMRNIIQIEAKWLTEVAPRYYRSADPNRVSQEQKFAFLHS